ncbi:hypothetical protein QBC40DRAFT_42692 [Triangularia verruculosa]|uniref:Uncharacterized protein n=1 Tax=Triangularia verruculosa TaxID=2587418 RepID=A0AAN6XNK4_9PEZI|nr:hypothetical protein QBC40DRAFT_42692 [Triangularia verruculosa]
MGSSTISSADNITDSEFQAYLSRYPACLEAISKSKGTKEGQKSLSELDAYRYGEALELFASEKPQQMTIDDAKLLVEWKLRHGKFRPSLLKLVSSNEPKTLEETVQKAVAEYRAAEKHLPRAIDILTQLKGIGPATASLLLAVHAPDNIIFFADEAFYWLECNGTKGPIKYNKNEYTQLSLRAQVLAKRLGVKAVDVEKVAFVIMRDEPTQVSGKAAATAEEQEKNEKRKTTTDKEGKEGKPATKTEPEAKSTRSKPPAKRKTSGDNADTNVPIRRSKRGKQA